MAIEGVQRGCIAVADFAVEAFRWIKDLIARVIEVVANFFTEIAQELFADCCAEDWNADPIEDPNPYIQPQPIALGGLADIPVDLAALRNILRRGYGNPHLSSRMTAADLSALCQDYPITLRILKGRQVIRNVQIQEISEKQGILDEEKARVRREEGEDVARTVIAEIDFPQQRITIGQWAKDWAEARLINIDPAHPYFQIFQEAFRFKNNIDGGVEASGDYRTYTVAREDYVNQPHFTFMIKSLMGFQELSRDDHRNLMRKLDNHKPIFEQNPAYKFARSLSKIYCYPTSRDWRGEEMDVNDKLQIGIGAPMTAFQAAQERGQILRFFQEAFVRHNICFDVRVTNFQQFLFNITHPHIEDFTPLVANAQTMDAKIFEYFRVFKNTQMFRMANETHPANPEPMYQNLKARGGNQAVLFRDFVTKARFEQYLAENGGPIRELQGEIGLPVPEIPFQVDWNGWIPTNFRRVPVNVIPQHLRVAGAVVGVKDPGLFVATVRKNRLEQYFLVFSKNRPMHYQIHNPILDYPHDWQGMDEAEIDQEALPLWRRQNGATVLIRNPVTYRVRVHSIDGDTATLDFRGEPIPRARWEAVLPDDQYWTA